MEGVYNATALLAERMTYINSMLNKYEKLPNRTPTSAALLGTSVPMAVQESAMSAEAAAEGIEQLPEDGGDVRTGLMGALAGLMPSAETSCPSDDGSDDGGSSSNGGSSGLGLSQIGSALFGGEPASGEARPPVPSGVGPAAVSENGDSSSHASATSSSTSTTTLDCIPSGERAPFGGPYASSSVPDAANIAPPPRLDAGVRSSIVEKRPSFKARMSQQPIAVPAGGPAPSQARRLLRVGSSQDKQVASLTQKAASSAPAYR